MTRTPEADITSIIPIYSPARYTVGAPSIRWTF